MTNSSQERPGKRERLVASAADLLHRQGVQGTTLAQIAEAADVPPGNVYYYFKTRDELVHAVIESQVQAVSALLADLDGRATPTARLKGLAESWTRGAGCRRRGSGGGQVPRVAGLRRPAFNARPHVADVRPR